MREKRSWRRWTAAGLVWIMVSGFAACGGAGADKSMFVAEPADNAMSYESGGMNSGYDGVATEEVYDSESVMLKSETAESGAGQTSDNSAYFETRKLIKTVNLDVETKEFDQLLVSVEEQVEALGGYIENMNTYHGSSYSGSDAVRYSSLTARIPKQRMDDFLNAVSEAGNVIRRAENVEDVTLAYVDMESRRNTLRTEQERLLVFLEKAESLEDIITLEERLSDVRYQLERMESQLRTYDNKVDFATVNLEVQEVKELTPVAVEEETAGQRLVHGFMESLENVKDGIVEFFIWIVIHLPYFAIWAAVIAGIVVIIKLIIRRRRRKKQAKQQSGQTVSAQGVISRSEASAMESKQDGTM